jgi:Predicted hydrolase (HAD superfamily)
MRKAVFFDLDGTLLPLDMQMFIRLYYQVIHDNGIMRSIDPASGHEIFEKAVYAMIANDGGATNADVFFGTIGRFSGIGSERLRELMDGFYNGAYKSIRASAQSEPRVPEVIKALKGKGYRLILSTNPLFPDIATNQRVEWAQLSPADFEYISYYDNSSFCKPNPGYYREILGKTGLRADECYIVGNDVREDMCAVALGFEGFSVDRSPAGGFVTGAGMHQGRLCGVVGFCKKPADDLELFPDDCLESVSGGSPPAQCAGDY